MIDVNGSTVATMLTVQLWQRYQRFNDGNDANGSKVNDGNNVNGSMMATMSITSFSDGMGGRHIGLSEYVTLQ